MGTRRAGFGTTVISGNASTTGTTSNSNSGRNNAGVLKDRANMSFMLVIMFFAVFGLIVLTEIFLIDDRHGANGRMGAFGGSSHQNGAHKLIPFPDRPDYEEVTGGIDDDYINFKGGFDSSIGLFPIKNNDKNTKSGNNNNNNFQHHHLTYDSKSFSNLIPSNIENRLPALDKNLKITHAEWLPVTNTRFKFFVYSAYYDDRIFNPSSANYMNINNIKFPSNIIIGGSKSGRPSGNINNNSNKSKAQSSSFNKKNNPGLIRIIGATKTRTPEHVWCRLWYRHEHYDPTNGNNITIQSITVAARVQVIRENWNLKYSAVFIICPLPNNITFDIKTSSKSSIIHNIIPEAVSIVARLRAPPTNRIFIQNRPQDRPTERESLAICVKPLHYNYNRVSLMYLYENK